MIVPLGVREDVARAIVAYGQELSVAGAVQIGGAFTPNPEADAFVKASPAAFLIGVLFTQGIPAERAWSGPYLLAQRLGHFDVDRIAGSPNEVAVAFAQPPALHRFVKTLPGWVCSAAARIRDEYGGRAENIWPDGAHVIDVTDRLLSFRGIGEKKAAMAVEILTRSFGVPLVGRECGSVAYDVQVRRVFMRTGLIDSDTPAEVHRAAEGACPAIAGVARPTDVAHRAPVVSTESAGVCAVPPRGRVPSIDGTRGRRGRFPNAGVLGHRSEEQP